MWFSGILSVFLMLFVLIAKSFLINTLFGQIEADVWNYADTYLLFMAFSMLFTMQVLQFTEPAEIQFCQ